MSKSEEKYRKLLELANSIILRMDTSGKLTYLNKFGLTFFGYKKKEIIGKPVIGAIAPMVESSGRDITKLIESIQKNPKKYPVNENENMRKDGSRVWVLWTNKGLYDARGQITEILSIGIDITAKKEYEKALRISQCELERKVQERTMDLKKAYNDLLFEIAERKVSEEALRESEIKYRSIVEDAIEGIFQTTAEGKYTMANRALFRMLGYDSSEEFISTATDMEGRLYASRERLIQFKEILQKTGYVRGFQTQYYKKDGSKIWVSLNVRALYDERGSFIFYEGTVEDITMQRVMDGTTKALSMAIEIRDPYTAGHQLRVTELASEIAKEMGFAEDHIKAIRIAGMLHDIGKIYVPAEFLSKPGLITKHEMNVLRDHSHAGYEILKDIEYKYPIAKIVLQHHERMNGTGYPLGISGEEILIEARIIAVADVVESMASHRPYRPSLDIAEAFQEIQQNKGTHYDETVVDACLRLFREKGYQLSV